MNKILVIGSLNMDTVIDVYKMPNPGETIEGKNVSFIPGGKGANQAFTLGKLGASVKMIGAVGTDDNGKQLINSLESANVDVTGIDILKNKNTGCAYITVDETGENSIIVVGGTNLMITKETIDKKMKLIDEADIIVMQLEIPLDIVNYVAKIAKEKGKFVILDPAPARKDIPDELYQNIDIIKPNETEIQILSGKKIETDKDLIEAARLLIQKGVKLVIVTLGSKGSMLVTKDECKHFEALKVETVDTTSAGDSFTAALAKALADNEIIDNAIKFAHIVSSIVVTKKGAQSSIPSMDEVVEFLRSMK